MLQSIQLYLANWHIPQDWPEKPGIVRSMEFLTYRITRPMNVLKEHAPHLVEPEYLKKNKMMTQIVNAHNRLAPLCIEWAQMNYQAWIKGVDRKVQIALRAPMLVRDQEGKFFVSLPDQNKHNKTRFRSQTETNKNVKATHLLMT